MPKHTRCARFETFLIRQRRQVSCPGNSKSKECNPSEKEFVPIDWTSAEQQSKTDHFYAVFSQPSQVRPYESPGLVERAMGIEENTHWVLNDFARFPESAK